MNQPAHRTVPLAAALALSLLMIGCGGGGRATNAIPAAHPADASAQTASLVLQLTIPAKKAASGSQRSPRYISPATQSAAITFVPTSGAPQTFNQSLTTAGNPSCHASLVSSTICTITFSLLPGSYTATFATYDGLLNSGYPTGNVLSANQNVPITILPGQANTLDVTFQGVPTSVVFVPGVDSELRGSMRSGFTGSLCFWGANGGAETISVFGVDADGNYILGPGAPTPSLTGATSTLSILTFPTPSTPNTFALQVNGGAFSGLVTNLTATVTPSTAVPNDSGTAPVSAPVIVTFDSYLCQSQSIYPTLTASARPEGITAGPDGALWYAENGVGKIGRSTTSGSMTEFGGLTSAPANITSGPDGKLWFTEPAGNIVANITTSGTVTEYPATPLSSPGGITSGPDGALWFTEYNANKIGRITTAGAITEFPIGTTNGAPWEITSGPDGNLWFTEASINQVGKITTSGVVTMYSVGAYPWGITTGPDNAIWFAEAQGNSIGRITTAGVVTHYAIRTNGAYPYSVVSGGDGALWFTEKNGQRIGRLSMTSTPQHPYINEYFVSGSGPYGIALGSDGTEWITGSTDSMIRAMR